MLIMKLIMKTMGNKNKKEWEKKYRKIIKLKAKREINYKIIGGIKI